MNAALVRGDLYRLEAWQLAKAFAEPQGGLEVGQPHGTITWFGPGEAPVASVDWRRVGGAVEVGFRCPLFGDVSQSIQLAQKPRGPLFRCPQCDRRTRTLYRPFEQREWACRRCHGLVYASQRVHRRSAPVAEEASPNLSQQPREAVRTAGPGRLAVQHAPRQGQRGRRREKRPYRSPANRRARLQEGEAYCCRCRAPRRYRDPRRDELHAGADGRQLRTAIRGTCDACGAQILRIVRPQEAAHLLAAPPTRGVVRASARRLSRPFRWDRQWGESLEAYSAFLVYRDLEGRRSLARVAGYLRGHARARPWGRLTLWSRRHDWVARARAWDDRQARERLAARRREWEGDRLQRLEEARLIRRGGRLLMQPALLKFSEGELDKLGMEAVTITLTETTPDGRRVTQVHRPSIVDFLHTATRMIREGQRLEREVLGSQMWAREHP